MKQSRKRTGWIDICKAIAIYLMVLGHTGTSENVSMVIHTFHMPIFFLLSGYCFNEAKNSDLGAFVRKRFRTLIIPYFVLGIGLFFFWDIALYVLHRPSEMRSISNLITSILWNNANASSFGVIQWFLPCLFFAEIIFASLVKMFKGNLLVIGGGIALISVVAYLYPNLINTRLPWALDCALMAVVFYGIGWLIKKTDVEEKLTFVMKYKLLSCIGVIVLALAALPVAFLNGAVNMRTITYGNYFLFFANAYIYSFVVIIVSKIIDDVFSERSIGRFLRWIGRNTLIILMLNSTCVRVFKVLLGNVMGEFNNNINYIINGVVAVGITIVCVIISEIVNRYIPWLIGKKR